MLRSAALLILAALTVAACADGRPYAPYYPPSGPPPPSAPNRHEVTPPPPPIEVVRPKVP